jgi:hypothetical protein
VTQLGKYEKYLIEEFFDDYRAGALSQRTFTRRVVVHYRQYGGCCGRDAAGWLHAQ